MVQTEYDKEEPDYRSGSYGASGAEKSSERFRSACTLCGCCCAITLESSGNNAVRVCPGENNYLCARGQAAGDIAHHPGRITTPLMRSGDTLFPCSWENAVSAIASSLQRIKVNHGPKSIGCLGSVHTTNEDNFVFQKFARTTIGTNNVDMLARHKMMPALNTVFPAGEFGKMQEHDVILVLDKSAGVVNPLTGREIVRAAKKEHRRLIVVSDEPNALTRTADVVIRPDGAIAGLARALRRWENEERIDIAQAASLLEAASSVAVIIPSMLSPDEECGIRELTIRLKNVTYYPLVRGANLQGGLDMGVSPSHYPGHQKVGPRTRSKFGKAWNAILCKNAGMTAVEMLRAIEPGEVTALYIMGDDPAKADPATAALLGKLDFLVVQDVQLTETAAAAHVVLPAAGPFEKTGTVTNLERRLRLLTKVKECSGESMPDWKIIRTLANRMGADMKYKSAVEIMMEIKSLVPMYRDLAVDACWSPEQQPADFAGFISSAPVQPECGTVSTPKGCTACRALPPSVQKK